MNELTQFLKALIQDVGFWLTASYVLAGVCIVVLLCMKFARKKRYSDKTKVFAFLFFAMTVIFSLRNAINFVSWNEAVSETYLLFNSLIETVRMFGLNIDYPVYINDISMAVSKAYGNTEWAIFFSVFSSFLYLAAPVTGGMVIFEILAGVFPRLRLMMSYLGFFRDIVYFSELNDESLALAESIRKDYSKGISRLFRPIMVFTDVYKDDEEEKSMEMLLTAKYIGAICLNNDLMHTHIRRLGKRKIFLIDRNNLHALQKLATFSDDSHYKLLKKTDVFLFSGSSSSTLIEDKIRARVCDKLNDCNALVHSYRLMNKRFVEFCEGIRSKLEEKLEAKVKAIKEKRIEKEKTQENKTFTEKIYNCVKSAKFKYHGVVPRIFRIDGTRNLVRNLLSDVPLYEPLVGRFDCKKSCDLNVTLVGAGKIGTEMFLSAYWYGQILGCNLCINVISGESEADFRDKINYINTDILKTCITPDNPQNREDILRIYPHKDEYAPPYFKFRYYQTNIRDDDIKSKMCSPMSSDGFCPIDSDYFVIALGSDKNNLSVAEKIKRYVSIYHLESAPEKNTVIAYVVSDSDLCDALNERPKKSKDSKNDTELTTGVYMYAFGSLREVYDTKNVYMKGNEKAVKELKDSYERAARSVTDAVAEDKIYKRHYYEYWADISRALHIKYKVFSAGFIKDSVFNCDDDSLRSSKLNDALKQYIRHIPKVTDGRSEPNKLINELSWLEHRRWNAFMRTNGFSCPKDYTIYCADKNSYKNLEFRLHPCIVECDNHGYREDLLTAKSDDSLDMLDLFSADLADRHESDTNYKLYDHPCFDFKLNSKGEIEDV